MKTYSRSFKRYSSKRYLPVPIAICAGFTLSLVSYFILLDVETERIRNSFNNSARTRAAAIGKVFGDRLLILESVRSFIYSSEQLERDQFTDFIRPFMTSEIGLERVSWHPRVLDSERADFEAAARRELLGEYQIIPMSGERGPEGMPPHHEENNPGMIIGPRQKGPPRSGSDEQGPEARPPRSEEHSPDLFIEPRQMGPPGSGSDEQGPGAMPTRRDEYFPVLYIEPQQMSRPMFGLDALTHPVLAEAIERARDSGEAIATAPFELPDITGMEPGFLVVFPVYWRDESHQSLNDRSKNLLGVVLGSFSVSKVIDASIVFVSDEGINIYLSDLSGPENSDEIYSWRSPSQNDPDKNAVSLERALLKELEYRESTEMGGRQWEIRCTPTVGFITARRTWYPVGVFPVGLLVTGLAVGYIISILGRSEKVERMVEERTAQLVRTNKELKETQLQLIQAAKLESIGRLAAGVAHEVKNPLATIQLGVDYLSNSVKDHAESIEVVQKMDVAVNRADTVVRGLVDFSRSEKLDLEKQDLNKIVEESIRLVNHKLMQHHITLKKDLALGLPPLHLDTHKMEQVLINLFMNGIQAMGQEGTLSVRTRLKQEKEGTPLVQVMVEDTGPGIPEEKLDKIFDPFFTTKPTGKGTGLGLSVTRNIVELHDATIEIHNRESNGASFVLTFRNKGEIE